MKTGLSEFGERFKNPPICDWPMRYEMLEYARNSKLELTIVHFHNSAHSSAWYSRRVKESYFKFSHHNVVL